ncbi:hypothetical protein FQN50_008512 [Emmonsiellopsis sp. PD_5]|nr:hypothetical protein FQN50_008512 [Emmonsiellopsis sp. PD_5]
MAVLQIATNGTDCYQLLDTGEVKQYDGSSPYLWKTIDKNVDNAQIVVDDDKVLYLRRSNSDVYRRDGNSWTLFVHGADKFWAANANNIYMWSSSTQKIMRSNSQRQWFDLGKCPNFKDLAVDGDAVYQLETDGAVYEYVRSTSTWTSLSATYKPEHKIFAGAGHLCTTWGYGQIFKHISGGGSWTRINDNDAQLAKVSVGEDGIFKLHKNGGIYKYVSGTKWEKVSGDINNSDIAVGRFLHRVTTEGSVSRLVSQDKRWQLLQPGSGWHTASVDPAEVYNGGYPGNSDIKLRIGNGAAGQSGLIQELGDAFIKHEVTGGSQPFRVAWYKSDTTESINYMKNGTTDAAITYHDAAESIAIDQNIAGSPSFYAFREHFLLVGPPSNPANLDNHMPVEEMFQLMYSAAESGRNVRFLSRYDKSATNIKESELWIKIGQVPWAEKPSPWYHKNAEYPIQALTTAARLGEYTLTDWGTYLSVTEDVRKQIVIYKKGTDSTDDPLLMPAHLLVSDESPLARKFAKWLISKDGQEVVTGFKKGVEQVYSGAP